MAKIKVLIVDDSLVFREVLSRGIATDSSIEIVATAEDPFDARDKILKYKPDVMVCDVEMPKMNGIEFIKRLLPQYPLPVIVVSAINDAIFEALRHGAVDFVTKPDFKSVEGIEGFIHRLINKIKAVNSANTSKKNVTASNLQHRTAVEEGSTIIAIGASTGGTEALASILKKLPPDVPGIVITQHIPPVFSRMFAERLDTTTLLSVKEAETGDFIESGKVLIAPGDQHMKVNKVGNRYKVECFKGEKINGHCPSVDVLFESVAKTAGNKSIGIILTGMGYDGAKGLLAMRRRGARTIGQDEASSVVYGMPRTAFNLGAVEKQTSLANIPQVLLAMLNYL